MFHTSPIAQHLTIAQRGILAEVVFGNPNAGCRNMGICKMHIGPRAVVVPNELKDSTCSCKKSIAFVRKDGNDGVFIHFLNYSLSAKQYTTYFPGNCFVVEAPYSLPKALCSALGLGEQGQFSLQPGHYPTLNDGVYHTISVRVQKTLN